MSLNKDQERIKSVLELSVSIFEDLDGKDKKLSKMRTQLWNLWKAGLMEEDVHDAVVYNWGEDRVAKLIEKHKETKAKAKANGKVS